MCLAPVRPHVAAIAVLSLPSVFAKLQVAVLPTTFNTTITTLDATSTITNLDNDASNHENGSSSGRGLKTRCRLEPY